MCEEAMGIIKIASESERVYFYEVSKVNFSKKETRKRETSSFMLWQARQCHNTPVSRASMYIVEQKEKLAKEISTSLTHQKSKHVFSASLTPYLFIWANLIL
jgi:hypothetical protein